MIDLLREGEGVVEVCMMGQWRSVCDDGWDENGARVFCKEHNMLTRGEAFFSIIVHYSLRLPQILQYPGGLTIRLVVQSTTGWMTYNAMEMNCLC